MLVVHGGLELEAFDWKPFIARSMHGHTSIRFYPLLDICSIFNNKCVIIWIKVSAIINKNINDNQKNSILSRSSYN